MSRAASLSKIPQSLLLSSQSLRPCHLAPLTSLKRRVLHRRPRYVTPGTPVVAHPSFYVVVFATRVIFRDVPLCIVVWRRIARPRNGFNIIRKDRNRFGGGVVLYVRDTISFSDRKDIIPDGLEMVCIELNLPYNKSLLISTWYRPPNSHMNIFNYWAGFLSKCDRQ